MDTVADKIIDHGYTPFPYFRMFIIGLIIVIILKYKEVNKFLNNLINKLQGKTETYHIFDLKI